MHKNAEILMEIAKEAAVNAEYWKEFYWVGDVHGGRISFDSEKDILDSMLIGDQIRRKPRTICIGDIDVPEPVRVPPEECQTFYYPLLTSVSLAINENWIGIERDIDKLNKGLVHLDKESAIIHAKALLSLTQKKE